MGLEAKARLRERGRGLVAAVPRGSLQKSCMCIQHVPGHLSYLLGGPAPSALALGQVIPSLVLQTKKYTQSSQMTERAEQGGR